MHIEIVNPYAFCPYMLSYNKLYYDINKFICNTRSQVDLREFCDFILA